MKLIQKIIFAILLLMAVPMALLNGMKVVSSILKPQLVYSMDSAQIPIVLSGRSLNYYIKTIYFDNLGYKTANNLHAELTFSPLPQSSSPEACINSGINQNVILQEGPKEGILLMRSSDTLYSEWGDAFQGELESYSTLNDFKNKRKEGTAIIRKDNETIMVAYKEHFHGSQRGFMRLRSFGEEPTITKITLESDEGLGKEKKDLSVIEKLFINKFFLTLLGLLIVASAILEVTNSAAAKDWLRKKD